MKIPAAVPKQSWGVWIKAFVITSLLKKLPHWHYANNTRFWWCISEWRSRSDDEITILFCFVRKCSTRHEILTEPSEKKCGHLFCLYALPHFASSNWPVITNLKNIADVRYDHVSDVPRWAGLWIKRVRPCVIPCQTTPKMTLCLHVSGRREKLSPRVCVRAGMCAIKPRYSAGLHSSTADLEKLFRGDCPTYPLRHNPPDSLVVLSV